MDRHPLEVDHLAVHQVEQRRGDVVAAHAAHAPDERREGGRQLRLREVAQVLRVELRPGLAPVAEVQDHDEAERDQRHADAQDAPEPDLDARPECASGWPRRRAAAPRRGPRPASAPLLAGAALRAAAGNRMRPSTKVLAGSGSTFMTTLASGWIVTLPHSGPCAQARTWSLGHALRQVDGDADVPRLHGHVLADELPVELGGVAPALGRAPGHVVDVNAAVASVTLEVELDRHHPARVLGRRTCRSRPSTRPRTGTARARRGPSSRGRPARAPRLRAPRCPRSLRRRGPSTRSGSCRRSPACACR